MSTLALANSLMSVFVPIGVAGAVIALACALVAAYAIARGAAGLAGGAIGVWIVGAVLSVSASFASLWTPFFVAAVGLGAALVIGTVLRLALAPLRAPRVVRVAPVAQLEPVVVESVAAKAPSASAARPVGIGTDVIAVA